MIANPAIPYPAAVPHPFTLNDLRMSTSIAQEPSSASALTHSGLVVAVALAIGAFIWLDPLHVFTPIEASSPAPAVVPSKEAARPTRQETIAPLTPVPATRSVEAPIAPAPVVRAPHDSAPVVRPRAASVKPVSRGNAMDKTDTTVRQASPKERTAPPALLTNPEEKAAPPVLLSKPAEMTDAPTAPKHSDDTKSAPKPAATNDTTPAAE